MNKFTRYFKGVREEARRIRWPDSRLLWKSVTIVIVISVISALAIVLSDWLTANIMKAFEEVFPKDSSESTSAAFRMISWIKIGGHF